MAGRATSSLGEIELDGGDGDVIGRLKGYYNHCGYPISRWWGRLSTGALPPNFCEVLPKSKPKEELLIDN